MVWKRSTGAFAAFVGSKWMPAPKGNVWQMYVGLGFVESFGLFLRWLFCSFTSGRFLLVPIGIKTSLVSSHWLWDAELHQWGLGTSWVPLGFMYNIGIIILAEVQEVQRWRNSQLNIVFLTLSGVEVFSYSSWPFHFLQVIILESQDSSIHHGPSSSWSSSIASKHSVALTAVFWAKGNCEQSAEVVLLDSL